MSQPAFDYRVVTRGGVLEGHDPAVVTEAFASLVNLEPETAKLYFIGKPRVVRKRTDLATAEKFLVAFQRIGVDSTVVAMEPRGAAIEGPLPELLTAPVAEGGGDDPEEEEAWETAAAARAPALPGDRIRKVLQAITSMGVAALLGALAWTSVAHAVS